MSIASATRLPLETTTNNSQSPPPSPPTSTAKTGPPILRHKSTQQALKPHLDSSESYPSPHSSIYEASINQDETLEWATPPTHAPSWENTVSDRHGNPVPLSFLTINPHTPHHLYPITEQNSFATLRPSLSLKSPRSILTLRSRSPGGLHRKSFSLSDLPPSPSESSSSTPTPPSTPLPQPVQPPHPPPSRSPTPPGLPPFNKPETATYRLPPPPAEHRFTQNFRPSTPEMREWRRQTIGLPRGVVMRGNDGTMVRGRFVGVRSGHLAPQARGHGVFTMPAVGGQVLGGPGVDQIGGQVEGLCTREPQEVRSQAGATEATKKKNNKKEKEGWSRLGAGCLACCKGCWVGFWRDGDGGEVQRGEVQRGEVQRG